LDGERERVLSTGSMFYEAPGAIHLSSGSASATEPARVLALHSVKRERRLQDFYDRQTRIANRRSPEAWTGYPYSQGNENSGTSVLLSRFHRSVRWRSCGAETRPSIDRP
jgi:hypothetical protein